MATDFNPVILARVMREWKAPISLRGRGLQIELDSRIAFILLTFELENKKGLSTKEESTRFQFTIDNLPADLELNDLFHFLQENCLMKEKVLS